MELVGKNEKIQILAERLDRIEIDANDLNRYYNVEENKKRDMFIPNNASHRDNSTIRCMKKNNVKSQHLRSQHH